MSPSSVDPGSSSISTLTVNAINTTSSATVALSCAVTSGPTGPLPGCQVSPTSVTTPASPTLTVTTLSGQSGTTPGLYTITVTGSDASGNISVPVTLNVIAVVPQYTIQVTSAPNPTSVTPGNGSTAVISIIPADGYGGANVNVTLACATVTPVVSFSPQCAFAWDDGGTMTPESATSGVAVPTSTPVPVTLTISTKGPVVTTPGKAPHAMLVISGLPLAGLALIAAFGHRKRRWRSLLGLGLLLSVALGLLLLPACGTTVSGGTLQTSTSQSTPNGTYMFTISAIDNENPPQAASNATAVTVTLTVN
jgi:hypothetical protein